MSTNEFADDKKVQSIFDEADPNAAPELSREELRSSWSAVSTAAFGRSKPESAPGGSLFHWSLRVSAAAAVLFGLFHTVSFIVNKPKEPKIFVRSNPAKSTHVSYSRLISVKGNEAVIELPRSEGGKRQTVKLNDDFYGFTVAAVSGEYVAFNEKGKTGRQFFLYKIHNRLAN